MVLFCNVVLVQVMSERVDGVCCDACLNDCFECFVLNLNFTWVYMHCCSRGIEDGVVNA